MNWRRFSVMAGRNNRYRLQIVKRVKRRSDWRFEANCVIDDYERGALKETLTLSKLAQLVGVSRQTVWRDLTIMERYARAKDIAAARPSSGGSRATAEMRYRKLEAELEKVKTENSNLIQNMVNVCRRLHEHGLDAHVFVGEAALDVEVARKRVIRGSKE